MRVRMLVRWLTVAAVASASLFATAAVPATASATTAAAIPVAAACPAIYPKPSSCLKAGYGTAPAGYVGWAVLNLNYCPAGSICTLQYRTAAAAWSWTGSTWRQASLRGDQWVYLYPYSGSWRWAWTQETGWLAIQNARFELR